MAQRKRGAPDPLQEIESTVDRMAGWVASNQIPVAIAVGAILVGAAGYGLYDHLASQRATEASTALSVVEGQYRAAMGAGPDSIEVPEPANPETAKSLREQYAERLRDVAESHPGTAAAVIARLEEGNRLAEIGNTQAALAAFAEAGQEAPRGSSLRGLALIRLARAQEEQEQFVEAAAAFEEAGGIDDFPLRHFALADAARSYANAGDLERAAALAVRLETDAPDLKLPEHVRSRLQEIRETSPASSDS